MFNQRLQTIGFFVLLAVALLFAVFLLWPFSQLLALSGILAVLFRPWYLHFEKSMKSEALAAFATVVLVLVIVLIPLFLIAFALYGEVFDLFQNRSFSIESEVIIRNLPSSLQDVGRSFFSDLSGRLADFAGTTIAGVAGVISNVLNFFVSLFLTFFTFYYFLKDGEKIKKFVGAVFPLSEAHESKLVDDLELAISGVVKGSFLVALIQGVVATIGFLIFGVPHPFIWGSFTVLAALVPTFGTALSLIPAVLYLILTGHVGAGLGMAIWGSLAVGMIDNFVGPKLVGRQANLHPLLVLFSVLGGIQFLGILGFLLGPIIMAVLVTLLNIYVVDSSSNNK